MSDNDLATLKAEAMRSTNFAGTASDDRLRFNIDLLNAIKAKENKEKFDEKNLVSDSMEGLPLINANKEILKNFNELYLKINKSSDKQSKVNVINKNGGNNNNGGENTGEKIVGDSADGGFLGMKFLSPLNEDLVMERSLSKSVLNVYM